MPANRRLLAAILGAQGHHLLEAGHGAEALATVRIAHPDLVITDVLMPVMDGYEFVRQLRLDPATARIPVVFHTANYGEREARELALTSGVAWVLVRPAPSRDVLRVVNLALSGESETGLPTAATPVQPQIDRGHLRLLTDKLSEKAEDLRNSNAMLRALINIGLQLSSEQDPDRLLESVCGSACELFDATYAHLAIVDPANDTIRRFVTCGTGATNWLAPGNPIAGVLARVVAERRTFREDNPGGEPSALALPLGHPEARALLAVPITSASRCYGWICLVSNDGRAFDGGDEDLALALAGQVGRLYELEHQTIRRVSAESEVRRLSVALRSGEDGTS
jgi:two-component system cell cycle sensor histidine kinase/response regulator CckA